LLLASCTVVGVTVIFVPKPDNGVVTALAAVWMLLMSVALRLV
jgi:hypothetical protein